MKSDTKMRITAFILSLIVLIGVGFCSFPTVSYADTTLDTDGMVQAQYDNWDSLPDDFKELGQAYYSFFKSKDPLDFFSNASEIPVSWFKILKDGTPVLSPLGQLFYYLDGGELFVEDKSSDGHHGGGGGRNRAEDTNPVVSSDTFVTFINNNPISIIPSTPTFDRSWKNNPLSGSGYDSKRNFNYFPFLVGGDYFGIDDCRDIYAIPYIVKDGVKYYSEYYYHLFYDNFIYSSSSPGYTETEKSYSVYDVYYSVSRGDESFARYYVSGEPKYPDYVLHSLFRGYYGTSFQFLSGSSTWYYSVFSADTSTSTLSFVSKANTGSLWSSNFYNSSDITASQENCISLLTTLNLKSSVNDTADNYGYELAYN